MTTHLLDVHTHAVYVMLAQTCCSPLNRHYFLVLIFSIQGAIHSIHSSADGFATGGKDGKLCLWNEDFTPVTSIDLTRTSKGYKGT